MSACESRDAALMFKVNVRYGPEAISADLSGEQISLHSH